MKGDTWQVTGDTWHMTHSVGWTFSQNFSSLALLVWDWQCFEYISTNHQLVSYSINHEAVCRTALATPGLLKIRLTNLVDLAEWNVPIEWNICTEWEPHYFDQWLYTCVLGTTDQNGFWLLYSECCSPFPPRWSLHSMRTQAVGAL